MKNNVNFVTSSMANNKIFYENNINYKKKRQIHFICNRADNKIENNSRKKAVLGKRTNLW